MTRPWENARVWTPPEGWTMTVKRHAGHACGWTCAHPADDPGGFHARITAHAETCPWPEAPELVETVSD